MALYVKPVLSNNDEVSCSRTHHVRIKPTTLQLKESLPTELSVLPRVDNAKSVVSKRFVWSISDPAAKYGAFVCVDA